MLPKGVANRPYYEPFIGGGALFFELQPKQAVINDYNEELINVYTVIRDNPNELIEDLKKHKNTSEYFYEIRSMDRQPLFKNLTTIERASRIIYLNSKISIIAQTQKFEKTTVIHYICKDRMYF